MQELKLALRDIRGKDYRDNKGCFHVVFGTCNRSKRTGGELIELHQACGCPLPPNCKDHEMVGVKDMATGKKYAVHNRLIFQYNHQQVFWV